RSRSGCRTSLGGRPSGHLGAAAVAVVAKRAAREDVAQLLGGVPGVDEARVERREAEAEQIAVERRVARRAFGARLAGAKIADDAARDQRLHDAPAVDVREARLAAARGGIARRHQLEPEAGAARLDERDEEVAECDRLGAQRRDA